ncbi:MAG TPA: cytochrome c3 family protein [Rubricoccaceae bacterium]|nr:cytochrome c3 family protein [Rubricoccaceae bacterium]
MPQLFPRRANGLPTLTLLGVLGGAIAVTLFVWYYFSPEFTDVGYMPEQPVPYSHALHAGQLGMDCRYCHNLVETSEHANIPPTQTCMNCHSQIRTESVNLLPVRESWATGKPIPWVNVHFIPDYAQFPHAPHVNVGVGCESCHGRIDQMPVVYQVEPLSMGWCLDCHRDPAPWLRDPALVTTMGYDEEVRADDEAFEAFLAQNRARIEAEGIKPPQNCSACHY